LDFPVQVDCKLIQDRSLREKGRSQLLLANDHLLILGSTARRPRRESIALVRFRRDFEALDEESLKARQVAYLLAIASWHFGAGRTEKALRKLIRSN
jgi:hypothetical protein